MPATQPDRGDVHVNFALSNVSVAHQQQQERFIATRVFQEIPSAHKSNFFYTYPKEFWFADEAKPRAPGAESAGGGYTIETDEYNAKVYAVHKDVADQVTDNADAAINPEREATLWVTQQMLIRRDRIWAENFFVAGKWANNVDVSAGTLWSDPSGEPIKEIRDEQYSMQSSTGQWPNVLVLGGNVWKTLQDNLDFLGRVSGGATTDTPAKVMLSLLANILELDEVLVASSVVNSANEGATPVIGYVHADNALLLHRPSSPGLMTAAAGYSFSWTGMRGAAGLGTRIKRFRLERNEIVRIEGQQAYDMKIIAPELGTLFFNTI